MQRGPKDPDLFRIKRYGARWYRDPLPADDTWPEMVEPVPAVTTIKKAWAKPFRKKTPTGLVVPLDAYRAAEYVSRNLAQLTEMHPEQILAEVATAPDRDLAKAADRGTAIHTIMEALAVGVQPCVELLEHDVQPFVPACQAFVADWQPEWLITEAVAVNRQIGFAGTLDAILRLDGRVTLVDYKSRGSAHGAYPEEACQLGGYASADYLVVTGDDGNLQRIPLPTLDAGAIISVTADDSYRVYPVDLAEARRAFLGMFETWRIRRGGESDARKAIGSALGVPPGTQDQTDDKTGHAADPPGGTERRPDDTPPEPRHNGDDPQPGIEVDTHLASVRKPESHTGTVHDGGDAKEPDRYPEDDASESDREAGGEHSDGEGGPGHLPLSEEEQRHTGSDQDTENSEDEPGHPVAPTEHGEDTTPLRLDGGQEQETHLRHRVRAIVGALAGRPTPWPWPDVPTFKSGRPLTLADLHQIDRWCWTVEGILGLPFPPEQQTGIAPEPTPDAPPRRPPPDPATEWAERGRALLSLLDDEQLARACAATAECETTKMSRPHYLALQAVVTQVSEPAGVIFAHWGAGGVEIRPVDDIELALLAAMPTEGTVTRAATKVTALQRAKRVAVALGRPNPRSYADVCGDLVLAACVAVGHGAEG